MNKRRYVYRFTGVAVINAANDEKAQVGASAILKGLEWTLEEIECRRIREQRKPHPPNGLPEDYDI